MPTYQYRCAKCEKAFERTETISEHDIVAALFLASSRAWAAFNCFETRRASAGVPSSAGIIAAKCAATANQSLYAMARKRTCVIICGTSAKRTFARARQVPEAVLAA